LDFLHYRENVSPPNFHAASSFLIACLEERLDKLQGEMGAQPAVAAPAKRARTGDAPYDGSDESELE
jgi:hypothetical protein